MLKKILLAVTVLVYVYGKTMAQAQTYQHCGTMEMLQEQLKADPGLQARMDAIEYETQRYIANQNVTSNKTNAIITIPVVFHVLYNTTAQNISDARINAQLDVLNKDFARLNSDASNTPAVFQPISSATNIQFCLAKRDPNGAATTGIIRKSTTVTAFLQSGNPMKFNASGGDDAWPAGSYLNFWVCNLGGGLLGYAQFPGGTANTDGVVCLYSTVGGPSSPGTATPYHLGRTATHEVGHWLNLRHIWGDATCGNDLVGDTPTQSTSNFGCPTFPHVTCSNGPNGDMFMNYMDYVDDACMNAFTAGQSARIDAAISTYRSTLATSMGCVPVTTSCGVPTNLVSGSITQTSAVISWTAVGGATSYQVRYRPFGYTTWTTVTTTTNSRTLTGLAPAIKYSYQVRALCSNVYSNWATAKTFVTAAATSCNGDPYESNNTSAEAKTVKNNVALYALISSATDVDYFAVTTTAASPNLKLELTNLPNDYDMYLYDNASNLLAYSQLTGTASELIKWNTATAATYKVYIFGYGGVFNTTSCYKFKASIGSVAWRVGADADLGSVTFSDLSAYPNPTKDQVKLSFNSNMDFIGNVTISDIMGKVVLNEDTEIMEGNNEVDLDLNNYQRGVYIVTLYDGQQSYKIRLVKE